MLRVSVDVSPFDKSKPATLFLLLKIKYTSTAGSLEEIRYIAARQVFYSPNFMKHRWTLWNEHLNERQSPADAGPALWLTLSWYEESETHAARDSPVLAVNWQSERNQAGCTLKQRDRQECQENNLREMGDNNNKTTTLYEKIYQLILLGNNSNQLPFLGLLFLICAQSLKNWTINYSLLGWAN